MQAKNQDPNDTASNPRYEQADEPHTAVRSVRRTSRIGAIALGFVAITAGAVTTAGYSSTQTDGWWVGVDFALLIAVAAGGCGIVATVAYMVLKAMDHATAGNQRVIRRLEKLIAQQAADADAFRQQLAMQAEQAHEAQDQVVRELVAIQKRLAELERGEEHIANRIRDLHEDEVRRWRNGRPGAAGGKS